jgi:adenylate cyclase
MGTEIERKFLVASDAWRTAATRARRMRQGYLARAKVSIRVRIDAEEARLNIKSVELGTTRAEYDYALPLVDAEELLDRYCGAVVEKTRWYVMHGGREWEVDEFHGANAGLVVAELELEAADAAFARPAWLGREVTDEERYYNVALAERPYSTWEAR